MATEDDRSKVLKAYAIHVAEFISKTTSNDGVLYKRVQELEQLLIDAKSSTKKASGHNKSVFPYACDGQTMHLKKDCPTSKAPKEITAYCGRVLKKSDQKGLPKVTSDIKDAVIQLHTVKETQIEFVRFHLINWGMPVALAAQFEFDAACKVLAIVSLI